MSGRAPRSIVFASPALSLGGVSVVLKLRFEELRKRGYDIHMLFGRSVGGESLFANAGDFSFAPDRASFSAMVARWAPDILVNVDWPEMLRAEIPASTRLVYDVHWDFPDPRASLASPWMMRKVSACMAPSHDQASNIARWLCRRMPVYVVPNALEDDFPVLAPIATERPLVLWVGRLREQRKNVRSLLELARRLGPRFDFVLLDGVGVSAEEAAKFRSELAADGLETFVNYRSRVPRATAASGATSEMARLFAQARHSGCLVSTSWSESFGLAVLEAMRSGVPVIAPAVAALPELIAHGVNGWLYPAMDMEIASSYVLSAVGDVATRSSRTIAGMERAAQFTPSRAIDALLGALQRSDVEDVL